VDCLAQPVERGSLVSLVIQRVQDALLRRELRAGEYLPTESELSKSLGIGKSSVREAIKMLQAMGVVEIRRGQGTLIRRHPGPGFISPLIFQLLIQNGYPVDLVELRMIFEPAVSVLAMQRATEADLAEVERALFALEAAVRAGTPAPEDDLAFHLAILRATKNPLVIRIGETIFQLFRPSIAVSMQHIPERAVRDHRRVFQALRARDEGRLRRAVLQSYRGWKESLHRKREARGQDPALRVRRAGRHTGPLTGEGGYRPGEHHAGRPSESAPWVRGEQNPSPEVRSQPVRVRSRKEEPR
jgi:GntR family transcriptional repressor for pyruvate dehydrogenase complex